MTFLLADLLVRSAVVAATCSPERMEQTALAFKTVVELGQGWANASAYVTSTHAPFSAQVLCSLILSPFPVGDATPVAPHSAAASWLPVACDIPLQASPLCVPEVDHGNVMSTHLASQVVDALFFVGSNLSEATTIQSFTAWMVDLVEVETHGLCAPPNKIIEATAVDATNGKVLIYSKFEHSYWVDVLTFDTTSCLISEMTKVWNDQWALDNDPGPPDWCHPDDTATV
jgi:hypothetical protein